MFKNEIKQSQLISYELEGRSVMSLCTLIVSS